MRTSNVAFLLVALLFGQHGAAAPAATTNAARVVQPRIPEAFVPLRPGEIEPTGWLRDWARAAADGITGHLDEWHPTFGQGWKGVFIPGARGAGSDGTGWPLEQCSYWLDGLIRLGYVLHDERLIDKAAARLRLVVDGVNQGGTSFIYWKPGKPQGFNSWAHSQMGRALVALYEATGDKRILDALVKAYADYPVEMGPFRFDQVSGMCNLDAILETYSFSGDPRLLSLARQAMATPVAQEAVSQWLEGNFTLGHAVSTYERVRLPALLYPWTGDQRLLDASLKALNWINERHLLPYGLASGEEFMSGVGALRKTETCNVDASIWSMVWMCRITGDGTYGDQIERIFFNAAPAPVARDFKAVCYFQSPNRIRSDSLPGEQPHAPGRGGIRFSPLGCTNVLCCVASVNRVIPNYIMHSWMATPEHGLAAVLYGPCIVSAVAGDGVPVKLTCQTTYPFEETVRIKIEPAREASFPLAFRIPGWCRNPRILLNSVATDAKPDSKGFAWIRRQWAKDDIIELQFPMPLQVLRGYETEYPPSLRKYFDYEPDAKFQKRRFPYASVSRGPLLFALAIPDVDANTPAPDAKWRYALDMAPALNCADIKVQRTAMPETWNWPLAAPISLEVPAQAVDWNPTDTQALPDHPLQGTKPETIRLIPYGCTKFRISMFPVTPKAQSRRD